MKYKQNNKRMGELEGSGLDSIMGNLSGEVECPKCGVLFDAGTGGHPREEDFICPKCKHEFTVKWENVK